MKAHKARAANFEEANKWEDCIKRVEQIIKNVKQHNSF